MRRFTLFSTLLAMTLLAGLHAPAAQAQGKTLKGGVQQNTAASLHRNTDARPTNNDPFSGTDDDGELIDAPKYKAESPIKPPKPQKKPLVGNVNDGGDFRGANPMMAPNDMGGEPDAMPQQVQQPQPPAFNPNDPDSSPDMQLAWDMWHKRVAQCIFERFNFFSKAAFKRSPPLMAKLTYTVTRDGQIINVNMPQKSNNVLFNVLVHQSVKSLQGDMNILTFPQGSRRMWVPKSGVFTQNYGAEGFKYTVGDRETVQGGGQRR